MTFITVRKDRFFSSQIQIQIQIIALVARRLKVAAAFSDRLVSYTLFPTMGQQNEESTLLLLLFIINKRANWPRTMLYKNTKVQ